MSIYSYIHIFFLMTTIVSMFDSGNTMKEYVIRKDFFNVLKAAEFTIYDRNEKYIHYRVESKIGLLQNVKLIVYPSKQEVGRLRAKVHPLTYRGEFSILDPQSNQWINGTIKEKFVWTKSVFDIEWNGNHITMEQESFELTSVFRDSNRQILAKYQLRFGSVFWTHKYDMKIYSTKYPEQIYLLALTIRHRFQPKRG